MESELNATGDRFMATKLYEPAKINTSSAHSNASSININSSMTINAIQVVDMTASAFATASNIENGTEHGVIAICLKCCPSFTTPLGNIMKFRMNTNS
jgi:hypothetical protein